MAISTPVVIATADVSATSNQVAAVSTVQADAGDAIIVFASASVVQVLSSFVGGAGNTYAIRNTITTNRSSAICDCINAVNTIPVGTTFTATFGTSVSGVRKLTIIKIPGGLGAAEGGLTNSGTTSNWTGGTTGTLAAGEHLVVGMSARGAAATNTPAAGYTEITDVNANSFSTVTEYQIFTGTTAHNPGGTWSAAGTGWSAISQSYSAPSGVTRVTSSRAINYDVLNSLQSTRAVKYDIFNALQSTRAINYNVLNRVLAQRALNYNIFARLQSIRALTYDVLARMQSQRALTYDVRNLVQSPRALTYDVRNLVQSSRAISYNIEGRMQSSRAITYDVLNRVQSARSISYNVLNRVQSSRAISYDIFAAVQSGRAIVYDVIAPVHSNRAIRYDIDSSGLPPATTQQPWLRRRKGVRNPDLPEL